MRGQFIKDNRKKIFIFFLIIPIVVVLYLIASFYANQIDLTSYSDDRINISLTAPEQWQEEFIDGLDPESAMMQSTEIIGTIVFNKPLSGNVFKRASNSNARIYVLLYDRSQNPLSETEYFNPIEQQARSEAGQNQIINQAILKDEIAGYNTLLITKTTGTVDKPNNPTHKTQTLHIYVNPTTQYTMTIFGRTNDSIHEYAEEIFNSFDYKDESSEQASLYEK